MESYGELNVFCFGKRWLMLKEVLAWAEYHGSLLPILEHLQLTEEMVQDGFTVDQERLQNEVNDFRYKQDLITSQETHKWLKDRVLSLDDLYTYVHRKFGNPKRGLRLTVAAWKRRCEDPARETWAELHFSGSFANLVDDFICRVAVAMREGILDLDNLPTDEAIDPSYVFLNRDTQHVKAWEDCYVDYCAKVADRTSCERRLKSHRRELLKVKYDAVSYKDLDAAKEACCCIRYDGEAVGPLAKRTGAPYESEYAFIEDLPQALQQKLFSAHAQECLDPIRTSPQRGYTVYILLRKTEPHPNNGDVRKRLQKKIVREHLDREITENLQWIPWQPGELL